MLNIAVFLGVGILAFIGWNIMVNFSRLNAALATLAASVVSVAEAIRNPQVDNNSQATVDEIAGRLEQIAAGLSGLAVEETAMDTADQIEADPPASEPVEPSGEGTATEDAAPVDSSENVSEGTEAEADTSTEASSDEENDGA